MDMWDKTLVDSIYDKISICIVIEVIFWHAPHGTIWKKFKINVFILIMPHVCEPSYIVGQKDK